MTVERTPDRKAPEFKEVRFPFEERQQSGISFEAQRTNGCTARYVGAASGSCEVSWSSLHPEHYIEGDNVQMYGRLACSGVDCSGKLKIVDTVWGPAVGLEGGCAVDEAGVRYWTEGRQTLDSMTPVAITDTPPAFDGEPEP